jgi:hypothetical protein
MSLSNRSIVRALVVTTLLAPGVAMAHPDHTHPPACLGPIETGKNSLYHTEQGVARNDLSGAATDGHYIIFDDDGGDTGFPDYGFDFVRVQTDIPDTDGRSVPLSQHQTDLEAATYLNGYFYVTTSLSSAKAPQHLTTRFRLDGYHNQLLDEQSVDLTAQLKDALRQHFGDDWYNSWKDLAAKSGGLNIEGLSRTSSHEDAIIYGLRSPLIGGDFPADLGSGSAIFARVKHPFGGPHGQAPSFDFFTVDFGGYGVRGMEWVSGLHSYVVSAGPVEKATDYHLWQVFPSGDARPLALPGYDQLCRPESVIQQTKDGKQYLVVLSEDSGPECAGTPFTYIRAEILPQSACEDDHGHH